MKRKMLFFERFMYIDGVTPINCITTARLRGRIDAESLRAGLAKVQAKHPLLRAHIVEENGEPLFVFEDTAREIPVQVLDRQSDEDWQQLTVSQWNTPFDTTQEPFFRILWIRSDEVSELMCVAHHCIADGGSVVTLLRELLQMMDQPETKLTPYHSYNSIEDLIPAAVLSDAKLVRKVEKRALLYKLFLTVLARKNAPLPKGNPYILYWHADAEQYEAIHDRCTSEGTTVYAALCVAFLQAFREVQGRAAKNKIMCPVTIRRLLRSIKSDMMFSFAPTIELSLPKQHDGNLWTLARQMKGLIAEKIEGMNVYEDLMLGDRMRSWVPKIVHFLRSSKGGHDIAFSNMGRVKIPAKYKNFQMEALLGSSGAAPWRNTNTLLATNYLNEMELAFISNERFLPQQEAATIQQRAIQILQDAMAQPVSSEAAIAAQ